MKIKYPYFTTFFKNHDFQKILILSHFQNFMQQSTLELGVLKNEIYP
jgi:hypothetical protein